jgi:hypothetical protein
MDSEEFTQIHSEADDALRPAAKHQDILDFITAAL